VNHEYAGMLFPSLNIASSPRPTLDGKRSMFSTPLQGQPWSLNFLRKDFSCKPGAVTTYYLTEEELEEYNKEVMK